MRRVLTLTDPPGVTSGDFLYGVIRGDVSRRGYFHLP